MPGGVKSGGSKVSLGPNQAEGAETDRGAQQIAQISQGCLYLGTLDAPD